jgi:hypothetical protein
MSRIFSRATFNTLAAALPLTVLAVLSPAQAQDKKPNVVMLMTDDTGWNDFGTYGGGANLGHPTPNIDRVAQEGAVFTSWYGQASCTAGRASFITGRIPIRSALSVVVVPGDENGLTKSLRRSPSSSRRTAMAPTSRASGIWVISPSSTRLNMASTK